MECNLICIGKTDNPILKEYMEVYVKRIVHYLKFSIKIIPDVKKVKNNSVIQQKEMEGELIKKELRSSDLVILLDEKGKEYSSMDFAMFLSKKMVSGVKRLVFVIGGPYGFSQEIYKQYPSRLALSKMTFSHQMIRLLFVEQFYRANTILKNEPYHHQ